MVTSSPYSTTTTPSSATETPLPEIAMSTRARPWLTYTPSSTTSTSTTWTSLHFDKYTTSATPKNDGAVSTTMGATAEATVFPTTSRETTEIVFFTHNHPSTFRDPTCRDMRYSCSFWLQHNPVICTEQKSFMKAQCAYTCKFCISAMDVAEQLTKHHQQSQQN